MSDTADEQAGSAESSDDPAAKKAAELKADIDEAETPGEVERILTKNEAHLAFMPNELADSVRYHGDQKKAALEATKSEATDA